MTRTLGERIRARRQRKRWKLKDLSESTGLSVPYLSDLERDQSANPTLDTLNAIARSLDCDVAELLATGGSEPGSNTPLSVSLQRFVDSSDFADQLRRLGERVERPADDHLRIEVIDFLVTAPRRSSGELGRDDWRQLLDFYMVIADR